MFGLWIFLTKTFGRQHNFLDSKLCPIFFQKKEVLGTWYLFLSFLETIVMPNSSVWRNTSNLFQNLEVVSHFLSWTAGFIRLFQFQNKAWSFHFPHDFIIDSQLCSLQLHLATPCNLLPWPLFSCCAFWQQRCGWHVEVAAAWIPVAVWTKQTRCSRHSMSDRECLCL